MAKKISENKITSLTQDWGMDESNGLPYSGQAVQEFIKGGIQTANTAYSERFGAVVFDTSTYMLLGFKNDEDKQAYLAGGPDSLIIGREQFNFTGTINQVKIINGMQSGNLFFTTAQDKAEITVGFLSQQKGITDVSWEEVLEDFSVTVAVDKGSSGVFENIETDRTVLNGQTLTFDVKKYIATGSNRVRVSATGVTTGATANFIYSVTLTTMYLSPSKFAWNVPFIEGTTYNLGGMNIGGAIQKELKVHVTNEQLGYDRTYQQPIDGTYVNNAYFYTGMEFPETGTGVYDVELWLDTGSVESDHLHYKIICVALEDVNTAQLVSIATAPDTLVNYDTNTLFSYSVYNKGASTASPLISVNSNIGSISEETLTDVPTGAINEYVLPIEIESESANLTVEATITFGNSQSVSYKVDNSASFPAVADAVFYLQPASRSNAQDNREVIINQATNSSVSATWSKMNWTDGVDGYTTINDRKCLYLPAYSKANINYQPLASFNKGKTIDIAYSVNNISDYDEPIISICDDPTSDAFRGILIYPDRIIVHSRDLNTNDLVQSYQYREDTLMSLQVSYAKNYKTNYGNLVTIAVNGVKKCEFDFNGSDNIGTASNIILGSNSSDLSIYSMRVYEKSFDTPDFMQNFINSLPTKEQRVAAYDLINSAIDDSYNVSFDKVNGKFNTMVVEMLNGAELPHYGLSKEYSANCNLFIDILDEDPDKKPISGTYLNQKIEGQGTTSMNYWIWNLRWKMDYMRITAKKNYASGTQAHKMGATAAFNDLHEAIGLTNETGSRVAVYQYPVFGFLKVLVDGTDDQYNYVFIGMYTIGPDKGDKETFGWKDADYKDTMMSLEGLDHNIKGAGYDYPYNKLKYNHSAESILNDKGEKATEVTNSGSAENEADIQAKLDAEYQPAYNVAYENNPLIKGTTATLEQMNVDPEAWGLQKDADGHAFQRFEFWIDGEYDIIYLNRSSNKYEKNGTNLLTQLNISASDIEGLTVEEKNTYFINKRVEAFRNNAGNYWHIEDNMFYVVFMLMFGAKDNGIKNTYPYKFGTLESGSRWRQRQDDLDSLFPYDNQGLASAKFWCEWADFSDEAKTAYVFKGEHCSLVQLLLLAFPDVEKDIAHRILDAMQTLSKYGSTTIDKLMGFFRTYFFDKAQYYFPKSVYNKDVEYTYEEAWPNYTKGSYDVDVHPLSQIVGDALETEMEWIEKRMVYIMSKYQYGPFGANGYNDTSLGRINYRTQIAQSRTLTPAVPLYPAIANGVNALNATERVMDGEAVTIDGAGGSNTNVYIMAAHYLSDIGDLSNLQVDSNQEAVISVTSKRLKRLKVGDEQSENVTSNLAGLNIGECPSITLIDARNLSSLTGDVDLRKCPRLQEALFSATDVRNITLQNGSKLTKLSLPNSLTTLALMNLKYLTEDNLEYGALANVEFFRVEGCALDGFQLLKDIYNTEGNSIKNIRVIGFAYDGDATDIDMLAEFANGEYTGINEDGDVDSTLLPVLEGTLNIDGSIYEDTGDIVKNKFPNITLNISGGYYIRFADSEVERICVANFSSDKVGCTIEDVEKVTDIDTVFKGNTVIQTFDEFDKFVNAQAVSDNAFNGCSSLESIDLSLAEEIGDSCFYNCSSLDIDMNLPNLKHIDYGGFAGTTSLKGRVNLPNLEVLMGGCFVKSGIEYVDNLGKVTDLGWHSWWNGTFKDCSSLKEVILPNTLTTITKSCFSECTALYLCNIPNSVTAIDSEAFYNCALLTDDLILPNVQTINLLAFYKNNRKYVELEGIISIGDKAFKGNAPLKEVIVGPNCTTIGLQAFSDDTELDTLVVKAVTPPTLTSTDLFWGSKIYKNQGYIYVPDASVEAYKTATNWVTYADRIMSMFYYLGYIDFVDPAVRDICVANFDTDADGVVSIEEAAAVTSIGTLFQGNTSITNFDEFKWFTGVTSLSVWRSIGGCTNLRKITLPSSLTKINGSETFADTAIEEIVIPDNVTDISGANLFRNCPNLKRIVIGKSVNSGLRENALTNVTTLEEIIFRGNIVSCNSAIINTSAVYKLDSENTQYVEENGCIYNSEKNAIHLVAPTSYVEDFTGVTSIRDGAFGRNRIIKEIILPDSVTYIGNSAFANSSITSVRIPPITIYSGSMNTLGNVFAGCGNLTSVKIENGFGPCIPNFYFRGTSIQSIVLPSSVTQICSSFTDCTRLKTIILEYEGMVSRVATYHYPIQGTLVESGTGYIYVPTSVVETYKSGDYWSTYASQIKPINVADTLPDISTVAENDLYKIGEVYWKAELVDSVLTWVEI